jgi:hypothetical protein
MQTNQAREKYHFLHASFFITNQYFDTGNADIYFYIYFFCFFLLLGASFVSNILRLVSLIFFFSPNLVSSRCYKHNNTITRSVISKNHICFDEISNLVINFTYHVGHSFCETDFVEKLEYRVFRNTKFLEFFVCCSHILAYH